MSAIVPYQRSYTRRGSRTVAQFASNGVAADVSVERVDKRNRCSWYAIKLASSNSDATGRLVGVRRGGAVDELGSVEVMPRSVGSGRFAVTTPRTGAYQAMYLEVWSGEMLLRVEAPLPPAPRRSGTFGAGAVLFVLGIAACCAGAMPLAFAHDANRAATARTVAVASVGAPAIAHAAPAMAQPAPARVLSFSARRDDAPGGETVLASYLAAGERGTIALLDPQGTVITSGAFTRVGTIRLRVPKAYHALPMTAQITVHRGATKAVSNVVLPPNAEATPRPSPSPDLASSAVAAEGVTPIDTASSAATGGMIAVEGHAVAGRPLALRVTPQTSPMRIELEDDSGAVIAETAVAPGTTHAALPLPPSAARATYLLALHYTRNGGEETVIRTVVAAPH
jgi:hypothetical protein